MDVLEREQRPGPTRAQRAQERAAPAVRRHRAYVAVLVVGLVVLLLAAPPLPATSRHRSAAPARVVVPEGVTPATPAYGAGTTVGGTACGPGVRQVTWSAYAPPCQPAWHGDNGGATAPGVTATTIRVSYRLASTAQLAALFSLVPADVFGTNAETVATLDAYVKVFNRQFELYGRKVVLVPYSGRSDFVQEDLAQGAVQTQQDAATVAGTLHAFADVSLVDSSVPYGDALADAGVVSSVLQVLPAADYQTRAPFMYTPGPNCTNAAAITGQVLGRQQAGLKAVNAGDPALRTSVRRFGVVYPQSTAGLACETQTVGALDQQGVVVDQQAAVPFDLTQLVARSQAAVAQMKAAGVTTVVCTLCDPVTPQFLMQAADRLDYHPEWWFEPALAGGQADTDALTRLLPADQVAHLISFGNQPPLYAQQEAVRAFELGAPAGTKPVPSFAYAYASLLQLFDALQLAGPDLTPANLAVAMHRIPRSASWGMLGGWSGAAGPSDPVATFGVVKWFPARTSPLDGRAGTWVACDGARQFGLEGSARVPRATQLVCSPVDAERLESPPTTTTLAGST